MVSVEKPFVLPESKTAVAGVEVASSAQERLVAIAQDTAAPAVLHLSVEGGGCSGFQYKMELGPVGQDDAVVYFGPDDCAGVAVDGVSAPFVQGAVLAFEDGLAGRRFVVENPNAVAGCGCGVSFAV